MLYQVFIKYDPGHLKVFSYNFFSSFNFYSRSIAGKEAVANMTNQKNISNPPDMSGWNPFGEDNFSKLTEEELLDREFDLLRSSKGHLKAYFASQ